MKKQLVCLVSVLFIACGHDQVPIATETGTIATDTATEVSEYIATALVVKDFEYMVRELYENFPSLAALERVDGIVFQELVDLYRQELQSIDTTDMHVTDQVIDLFQSFFRALSAGRAIGHLGLVTPQPVNALRDTYAAIYTAVGEVGFGYFLPPALFEAYSRSADRYCLMGADVDGLLNYRERATVDLPIPNVYFELGIGERFVYGEQFEHFLAQQQFAYVRIPRFSAVFLEANMQVMSEFYEQIQDKNGLIIDIRGNPGGHPRIWWELFVLPNIVSVEGLSEGGLPFFIGTGERVTELFSDQSFVSFEPMEQLSLPVELSDVAHLQQVVGDFSLIEPLLSEGVAFGGDIYLLIDGGSASASDAFARFARATGFATLVGEPTFGTGGGAEFGPWSAAFVPLPHTGLIFRMDLIHSINERGVWNEEQGTLPDIWNAEGMNAIETLIRELS